MPRHKITPFPPWQSLKQGGYEQRYTRLGNSQMLHPALQNLNHLAYRIYTYMLLESGGKPEFEFPYSRYKKFASKDGFQKALIELAEAGLIEIVAKNANLRKPNRYRFSTRWKDAKNL